MSTARVHLNGPKSAHPLLSNLEAAGIQVLAVVDDASRLAREVVRPGKALFRVTQAIAGNRATSRHCVHQRRRC
ncbi:hypothetical protein [Polaromonas sp.]|uniref:hypothetical protein n=1 Tax=Polaromonas sp. TaxID=1869339 RepID=UPI0018473BD9|nr:hypothetical protein [Polaromonas sp.]NML86109.1 hypothetical protein [Polaromonas sp.]